jgi:mono/diheme cytochrome c family protein
MLDKEQHDYKWSTRKKICCVTGLLFMSMTLLQGSASASDLDVFLAKCGSCHKKGAEAAPVNPADKAGLVWEKYFKRNRHSVDISSSVNEAEQAQILAFLKHHAADSDHPVAAVIPK